MDKPYEPEKLISVIKEAEKEQYDVIIVDSLTHYWAGEGGLLERHEKIGGNSYTAWAKVTPVYQRMMETILQCKSHIIFTMRTKQDYVLVEKNGKQVPEKVGLAPIMRDGAEYEVTVAMNVNMHHLAEVSKDRTGLFDGRQFTPDESIGKTLLDWLENGVDVPAAPPAEPTKPQTAPQQPAQQQSNIKWPAFWANMKTFGLSEEEVHKIASDVLQKDISSLTEVIATQQELNKLTMALAKHKKTA
jgi:hypothetical protein